MKSFFAGVTLCLVFCLVHSPESSAAGTEKEFLNTEAGLGSGSARVNHVTLTVGGWTRCGN
ncbi:MAG: hypothetical protein V2A34_10455 [Lentisphaerota bacterium]